MENQYIQQENQLSVIIFQVGNEEFVINLLEVKEIIQTSQIRRLPRSFDFIEGIYNYRGNIIHIINLKKKLNLIEKSLYKRKQSNIEDMIGDKKFIIILNINKMDIGFYVDRIINISTINIEDIVGLDPIIQTNLTNVNYINGIVKFKERPRIFINLEKVLTDTEKMSIEKDQKQYI